MQTRLTARRLAAALALLVAKLALLTAAPLHGQSTPGASTPDAAATAAAAAPQASAAPTPATPGAAPAAAKAAPAKPADDKPKIKDAYKPLQHGQLIVWFVEPSGSGPTMTLPGTMAQPPIVYVEQTTGNFGQNAATFGVDAGNFGVDAGSPTIARVPNNTGPDADADAAAKAGYREQTSSSFGQNSGAFGNAASNHGQTAGSFGQTAGNYGIDASNYGVDASDYGHSLSNLTAATEPPPVTAAVPFTNQMQTALTTNFPSLKVQYVDVGSSDMKARLRAAATTKDYPDVVVLDGFATSWPGFPQDVRDALLPGSSPEPNRSDRREDRLPPSWYITRHAQHSSTAQALSVYLDDKTHAISN